MPINSIIEEQYVPNKDYKVTSKFDWFVYKRLRANVYLNLKWKVPTTMIQISEDERSRKEKKPKPRRIKLFFNQ